MRGTLKQIQQKCRPDIEDIGYNKFMAEGDICETYKKTDYVLKLIKQQTEMAKKLHQTKSYIVSST